MGILLENVAVRNDALQMTQNLAEPVSRLSSRTGRFPWLFPSLNLDRSRSELATPWVPVEILYASSRDRICLFRGRKEGRSRRLPLQRRQRYGPSIVPRQFELPQWQAYFFFDSSVMGSSISSP